jgi:hypothetical protein
MIYLRAREGREIPIRRYNPKNDANIIKNKKETPKQKRVQKRQQDKKGRKTG